MPNIAAVDIGSNAFRMVVGRTGPAGKLEILDNVRLPVRLGMDAFSTGILTDETMQKAVDAFLHFRNIASTFEVAQCRAVATSAMREAVNSQALVERIKRETGFQLEVISGEEEARLVHLAVLSSMDLDGKTSLLIDIGGGSVELLVCSGDNILSSQSLDMGTVRMLQRVEAAENQASLAAEKIIRQPKSNHDQSNHVPEKLHEHAEAARGAIDRAIGKDPIDLCIGTGGNLEEMGRLRRRLLKRTRSDFITLADLDEIIAILAGMSVEERIAKIGLNPDRADVILPASIVLRKIAQEAHVKKINVPGVGLKDGVLYDMLPRSAAPNLPRQAQVLASVERIGRKYAYDAVHADATARLAERIFDQSLSLHRLTEKERILLGVAARLHDIGHYINTIHHEQHGFYLLMNSPFIGLSDREREIAANVISYHRRGEPSASDENLKVLLENDRQTVIKLAAILRIADALDTGHLSRVQDVILEQQAEGNWQLHLVGSNQGMLEQWAFQKRKALFEQVFGVTLQLVLAG